MGTTACLADDAFGARPAADWNQGYVGLTLGTPYSQGAALRSGYGGALLSLDVQNGLFPSDLTANGFSGALGMTVGRDVERGGFVAGVAVDGAAIGSSTIVSYTKVDPNPSAPFTGTHMTATYETDVDNLATARLRVGYALGDTMVYATGGLAGGHVTNKMGIRIPELAYTSPDWSEAGWRFGYVVGVGAERQISSSLRLTGEVQYYNLEDARIHATDAVTFPGNHLDYSFANDGWIGRLGLSFLF